MTARKQSARARQTRRRILDAAAELFIRDGYGATTLQAIADRAGVSVQSVYFVFGNKRTLLRELVRTTVTGDDENTTVREQQWFDDALAAGTAPDLLRAAVHEGRLILDRVAPIAKVVDTAIATDSEVKAALNQDGNSRYTNIHTVADALAGKPGFATGITTEAAADVLYCLLSPELYLLFVRDRGWSPERWEKWTYLTLCTRLCDPSVPTENDSAPG
ncbi:TetR/AcrR family transcriptional regulator [Nocardia wallacei]|uniref:TetR/AcrR family transcriptional regulator n=1 Tax=Nocardia wallacei TaxID=480035 RepID=UPI002456AE72|nr:TetR/AcrR family transcriptional regulator [Nocardia wallacei]